LVGYGLHIADRRAIDRELTRLTLCEHMVFAVIETGERRDPQWTDITVRQIRRSIDAPSQDEVADVRPR
jgi:hypothetical protein